MAKNKSTGIDATTGEVHDDVELSERDAFAASMGFETSRQRDEDDFTSLTQEGELLYIVPQAGHVFRGVLLGRFKRPGKSMGSGYYYRIELTDKALVTKGKKDEQETFEAGRGTVVNFDERSGVLVLKDLCDKMERGDVSYEILVRTGTIQRTGNGQRFWPFQVKYRALGE